MEQRMRKWTQMFFFGILIFTCSASAQQWVGQIGGVSTALFSVQFIDSLRGWAVGDSGMVLHTCTAGQQWTQQLSGVNSVLRKVFFVDSLSGWAVGSRGVVIYTKDGGNTWRQKAMSPNPPYWDVHFADSLHGWIVGGTETFDGVFGVIFRTTDGGSTWTETIANDAGGFQGVFFLDSLRGWVVGGKRLFDNFDPDIVLHTTNGGNSWQEQHTPTDGPLYRVEFSDSLNGWAGGFSNPGGTVALHTTDGGTTWLVVSFQPGPIVTNEGILDIEVTGNDVVWLVRVNSVHRTMNEGALWQEINPSEPSGTLAISFSDGRHGWLVGGVGHIWKYSNPSTGVIEAIGAPQDGSLSIFPNPTNGQVTIQFQSRGSDQTVIEIYSLVGQRVFHTYRDSHTGVNTVVLDPSMLGSGVYFARVWGRDRIQWGRFIINK